MNIKVRIEMEHPELDPPLLVQKSESEVRGVMLGDLTEMGQVLDVVCNALKGLGFLEYTIKQHIDIYGNIEVDENE